MLILRFIHDENRLYMGDRIYRATCPVRNELNGERSTDEIAKTWPITSSLGRQPYYPRKFPTGLWFVKKPEWTGEVEFAPVKIPTDAIRRVLTWDIAQGKYQAVSGNQEDAFYHLHYSEESRTTLGCIRLDSAEDAKEIARTVMKYQNEGEEVWLEVIASKKCDRDA